MAQPQRTEAGAEAGDRVSKRDSQGGIRALGLGLITGAADDDCSAIGTYASAGAKFGPALLWTAPVTFPMMFTVVYLSSKLGQVSGRGLFQAIRDYMPRWVLYATLVGVMLGNTIEAAADLGGMAAAINLFVPLPIPLIVIPIGLIILAFQIWGSYTLIRNIFRWLALSLLAYVVAAVLAKPDPMQVLRGTFIPTIQFNREFLSILVAIIGTTLSAYLYTWQSNEEVEEEIAQGRTTVKERKGARHSLGHGLLQHHHVLHHPGDRLDALPRRSARDRDGRAGRRCVEATGGRRGWDPVRRRDHLRRLSRHPRHDRRRRVRSGAVIWLASQPPCEVPRGERLLRDDHRRDCGSGRNELHRRQSP